MIKLFVLKLYHFFVTRFFIFLRRFHLLNFIRLLGVQIYWVEAAEHRGEVCPIKLSLIVYAALLSAQISFMFCMADCSAMKYIFTIDNKLKTNTIFVGHISFIFYDYT